MRLAIWVTLAQGDFSNQEEEAERLSTSSGLPGTGNKSQSPGSVQNKNSGKPLPALDCHPEKLCPRSKDDLEVNQLSYALQPVLHPSE